MDPLSAVHTAGECARAWNAAYWYAAQWRESVGEVSFLKAEIDRVRAHIETLTDTIRASEAPEARESEAVNAHDFTFPAPPVERACAEIQTDGGGDETEALRCDARAWRSEVERLREAMKERDGALAQAASGVAAAERARDAAMQRARELEIACASAREGGEKDAIEHKRRMRKLTDAFAKLDAKLTAATEELELSKESIRAQTEAKKRALDDVDRMARDALANANTLAENKATMAALGERIAALDAELARERDRIQAEDRRHSLLAEYFLYGNEIRLAFTARDGLLGTLMSYVRAAQESLRDPRMRTRILAAVDVPEDDARYATLSECASKIEDAFLVIFRGFATKLAECEEHIKRAQRDIIVNTSQCDGAIARVQRLSHLLLVEDDARAHARTFREACANQNLDEAMEHARALAADVERMRDSLASTHYGSSLIALKSHGGSA